MNPLDPTAPGAAIGSLTEIRPQTVRRPAGVEVIRPQRELQGLRARDREVRAHERAHLGAAGALALGGANFELVTGPDGQRYAVAGEVRIDTAEVPDDPQATLEKAERIIRAALAPAEPSATDRQVAAEAAAMAARARVELARRDAESPAGLDRLA